MKARVSNSESTCVSVFTIKRRKGATVAS